MNSDLFFENKKYIPAKDASRLTGYSKDYIGQLCRGGKVLSKKIGATWYVGEESLLEYKNTPSSFDFAKNLAAVQDLTSASSHLTSLAPDLTPGPSPRIGEGKKNIKFYNFEILKPLGALACAVLLIIGAWSLPEDMREMAQAAREELPRLSTDISHGIAALPGNMYQALDDVTVFYAARLAHTYITVGTGVTEAGKKFFENPPVFVLDTIDTAAVMEVHAVSSASSYLTPSPSPRI